MSAHIIESYSDTDITATAQYQPILSANWYISRSYKRTCLNLSCLSLHIHNYYYLSKHTFLHNIIFKMTHFFCFACICILVFLKVVKRFVVTSNFSENILKWPAQAWLCTCLSCRQEILWNLTSFKTICHYIQSLVGFRPSRLHWMTSRDSASHCFLLAGWTGRSARLLDSQWASHSASLCTNLLQPNKTRYQRMTRNTSPPGIFLLLLLCLVFFLPSPLRSKRISEFHFSLFAAMLEARWQEQYKRNIPVISKKELKVELFSEGESCHLSFFFPSFPSVYLTRPKNWGFIHTHAHKHTHKPPEEWLASREEMRPDNLPFPAAAGCQKRALFLLRDPLPKMPGIKKEKTAGHCCVT